MLALNTLVSSGKSRKRIGRGGDLGGTSTRGHQGQGSRSGGSVGIGFEGGQMPLLRRLPKRGFNNNRFRKAVEIVNLDQLEKFFNVNDEVSPAALIAKGIIKANAEQVKVLGSGTLNKSLKVHVHAVSAAAAEIIKKQGGEVVIITGK
jgi:large subunit ribosomal protein L15